MRDHQHGLVGVDQDDPPHDRKRARQHGDPGLAALGGKRERVGFPRLVFPGKPFFDFLSRQSFPPPMADLLERGLRGGRHAVWDRQDGRRLGGTAQGAAIDCRDRISAEPRRKLANLFAALVGQIDAGVAGESVFRRQRGRAMAHEEQPRGHSTLAAFLLLGSRPASGLLKDVVVAHLLQLRRERTVDLARRVLPGPEHHQAPVVARLRELA